MVSAIKKIIRGAEPAPIRFLRLGHRAFTKGEAELRELKELVTPNTVVLDVGANVGEYAYSLAKLVGRGGRVICFEPQPSQAEFLRRATSPLPMHIDVVECALSSKTGEADLYIPIDTTRDLRGYSSLEPSYHGPSTKVVVKVQRLDDIIPGIIQNYQSVSFIKIDVEGHERDVLEGSILTLDRYRPNLLVEIEQRHSPHPIEETFHFILARGYSGWYLDPLTGRTPISNFSPQLQQGDWIAGRRPEHYINNFFFVPNV